MVKKPETNKPQEMARSLVKALAQATPVTAVMADFFGYLSPTDMEKDLSRWRNEITDQINSHEQIIKEHEDTLNPPAKTLSGLSANLAAFFANNSDRGLATHFSYKDIETSFHDHSTQEIQKALYQLEHYSLVKIANAIGGIAHVITTLNLHTNLDKQILHMDTVDDARTLAKALLDSDQIPYSASMKHYESKFQWEKRRLNPAIWYLKETVIPESKSSKRIQDEYSTDSFIIDHETLQHLKSFLEEPHG